MKDDMKKRSSDGKVLYLHSNTQIILSILPILGFAINFIFRWETFSTRSQVLSQASRLECKNLQKQDTNTGSMIKD